MKNKPNRVNRYSVLALAVSLLSVGAAEAAWIKTYGTANADFGATMPSSQGGYYLSLNSIPSSTSTKPSALIAKLNTAGKPLWTKKITSGAYDNLFISELGNGRLLLHGTTQASSSGATNAVWAEYTVNQSTGALTKVFSKTYKGSGDDDLFLTEDSTGALWGQGSTTSFEGTTGNSDMIIAKINPSTGVPIWSSVLNYDFDDSVAGFIPKGNQFILAANTRNSDGSSQKIVLGLLDSQGLPVSGSFKKYGGTGISSAIGIKAIANGNYLLYGVNRTSNTNQNSSGFIIKLNSSLGIVWSKQYNAGTDAGFDITEINENSNGSFTVNGFVRTPVYFTQGGIKFLLYQESHPASMQISSAGAVQSKKSFEYQAMDTATFYKSTNGNYLLSGQTMDFDLTGQSNGNVDMLYGNFSSSVSPVWVKTFGAAKSESGFISAKSNGYRLSGSTNSWGAGSYDVLSGDLDTNGDVPGCPEIKEVTMTQTTPTITAANLGWTPQAVNLIRKGAISNANITLTVSSSTALKVTTVCTN